MRPLAPLSLLLLLGLALGCRDATGATDAVRRPAYSSAAPTPRHGPLAESW